MFRRILVPIDGSAPANLGLREAITMAKDHNATLGLGHVWIGPQATFLG